MGCADRIIFCFKSSLHTFRRKHIHTRSHINPFETNCFYNNHYHIASFCTQTKEVKEQSNEQNNESEDENDSESEYEYEYETDDEFDEEENEQTNTNQNEIEHKHDSEISENFDYQTYSDNILSELFENLPENGRIDGKSVEDYISPLILRPLEVFEDVIHNQFVLMHNDMNALFDKAYTIPMENESELRDVIDLAFDKLNIYTSYIDNHFNLRHSPKHYLMRQLRVNHGKIVFLSMRKIMYCKYPQWAQSDNWATDEMGDRNKRDFIISENDEYFQESDHDENITEDAEIENEEQQ